MASTVTELLRRRFGGKSLPYDAEIEYLQTSGTQYINTGIILNTRNFELRLKFQWVGSTASQFECFVGVMAAGYSYMPRSGFYKYNGRWMYGTNSTTLTNIDVDGSLHEILVSGNSSTQKETFYLDGIRIGTGTTTATGLSANTLPYFLGCRNRDDSVDNPATARFMSLNYKKFGEASHTTLTDEWNFIPVRIGSVGYMYETINGTLMGNIGSGDFILGNDK